MTTYYIPTDWLIALRKRLATTPCDEVTMAAPSEVPNADLEAFWSSLLATLPGWELGPRVYRDSGRTRDLVRRHITLPSWAAAVPTEPEPAPAIPAAPAAPLPQPATSPEGDDIFAAFSRPDEVPPAVPDDSDLDPLIPLSDTAGVRKSAVRCYEWRHGFTAGGTVFPARLAVYTSDGVQIIVEMDDATAKVIIAKLVK